MIHAVVFLALVAYMCILAAAVDLTHDYQMRKIEEKEERERLRKLQKEKDEQPKVIVIIVNHKAEEKPIPVEPAPEKSSLTKTGKRRKK